MVDVRKVRMSVTHRFVPMLVSVELDTIPTVIVNVPVMTVVYVRMTGHGARRC